MTPAIRGDRASSLCLQLGPSTWLLAVSRGFGRIGGLSAEHAVLTRLRAECERRLRRARFRRAIERPQAAATAMLAVLTRVNGALYASTASHDDYVTAAASLTAVVVVQQRAYVMHAGATAAYLVHGDETIALCSDDVLVDRAVPLLARAIAASPALDVSITNARLVPGDTIVLLGRRLANENDLRHPERSRGDALVARFEEEAPPIAAPAVGRGGWVFAGVRVVVRAAAAIGLLILLVLAH